MMSNITLGSLFDGAGGFPLAGMLAGITPIWNSEIEPFPIRVTTKRFPNVKHYGDVCALNGAELEPVDVITFGSPCQDMSCAGKRAGLNGSRSSLFYEAIRIIKEMRAATNGTHPRYIVWENVSGALSCSKGEDFRIVLEQVCSIAEAEVSIPRPAKWMPAGEILGCGYSVAWRVVDAQYWGVPQMRRRIYLVADLNGESAGEIQFEQDRLYGNSWQSTEIREEIAGTADRSIETTSGTTCLNDQGGSFIHVTQNVAETLRSETHGHLPIVFRDTDNMVCLKAAGKFMTVSDGVSGSLMAEARLPIVFRNTTQTTLQPYSIGDQQSHSTYFTEKARTLNCRHTVQAVMQSYVADSCQDKVQAVLRYLTPLECCRLQGFPDNWCDGLDTPEPTGEEIDWWYDVFETHRTVTNRCEKPRSRNGIRKWLQHPQSDNAEYRMWGNSLAIPNAYHVLAGIAKIEETART